MGKLVKIVKLSALSLVAFSIIALLGLSLPLGGRRALSVQTGSMEPAIKTGSLVLVNRIPVSELKIGDIITYTNAENTKQTITHRVVQIQGLENGPKQIITRGDANTANDKPVNENMIVGKVTRAIPYAGRAINFTRTLPGLVLIIYIPALFILIYELRRLTAYYRSKVPYVLAGYQHDDTQSNNGFINGVKISAVLVVLAGLTFTPVAFANFKTTAILSGNTISSSGVPVPPTPPITSTCTINNSNSVNVNVHSNQSASSGNASSSNNATTGNVTSGNTSNNSTTNVSINTTNNSTTCTTQ